MSNKRAKAQRRDGIARDKSGNTIAMQETRMEWRSGPLPDAEELERLERLVPGSAERIIQKFEQQVDHRHSLENFVIHSGAQRSRQGLAAGFIVALSGFGVAIYGLSTGHEIAAAIIGGLDLVGLVTVFVTGSAQQRQERGQKDKLAR